MSAIRFLTDHGAPPDQAEFVLLFVPYAGAGAQAGRRLAGALPSHIAGASVQYPGRGDRRDDPPHLDIVSFANEIADEIAASAWFAGKPVQLYGHSMGAAIAFETARLLEARGVPPARLIVSGRRAPGAGLGVAAPRDDDTIVAHLRATGAVAQSVLARPAFRESILSVVRHDFAANAGYTAPKDAPIATRVTFLLSNADSYVDRAGAEQWADYTRGGFDLHLFDGDHFFLNVQPSQVVATIVASSAQPVTERDTARS